MPPCACRLIRTVALAVFLVAVAAPAFDQEVEDGHSSTVDAAAHEVARQILGTRPAQPRPPFTSDTEHARSIDPVLTRGAPIWIHEALPSPPLTALGGKVFSYTDFPYDPLDAPVLKIRPIDGDQVIPFLVRLRITPGGEITENATVTVSFPAPPIFEPLISHLRAWVGMRATEVSTERWLGGDAQIRLRVPLNGRDKLSTQTPNQTLSVMVAGELHRSLEVRGGGEQVRAELGSEVKSARLRRGTGETGTSHVPQELMKIGEVARGDGVALASNGGER